MSLILAVILFFQASYYLNIFILYRPLAKIKSAKNEDIHRVLTMSESFDLLRDILTNKF